MKGYKRQIEKNFAPQQKSMVMQDYSEQCKDVYGALGNAYDSAGEEEFDEVQEQMMSAAPRRGGGGGGGGGGAMFGSAMAQPAMRSAMMQEEGSMYAAPKSKSRAKKSTANIGGKKRLNDEVSATLYKMSKK